MRLHNTKLTDDAFTSLNERMAADEICVGLLEEKQNLSPC